MVFKFRMLSDENDNFVRDFELLSDTSLLHFHQFILRTLRYQECMASFFTADGEWQRRREFTLMDMGDSGPDAPAPMDSVMLRDVLQGLHDRLIWLFDIFTDRAYYLEFIDASEPVPGRSYPAVVFEHAPAPDQFDPELNEDEGSIFEQMMGDYSDFDGDDSYDDEY